MSVTFSYTNLRINGLYHEFLRCAKIITMRLDKFLKVSRLIKRRTVANEVSGMGRIFVNGNPAKPSKQIKENDIIEIKYSNHTTKVKVLFVPQGAVSVQQAPTLYEEC